MNDMQVMSVEQLRDGTESPIERTLLNRLEHAGLPKPEMQFQPVMGRKWRVDFCWRYAQLIVEVEGGIWRAGRHVRPKGFRMDAEKYNTLTVLGWRVLRVTPEQINSGEAARWVAVALNGKAA
ncbi:MAG: DUF559 domain-containing protein [Actinobacteria bacterium]|nr:DUF559 domain-containing protein [Actinomycetota bacterium]